MTDELMGTLRLVKRQPNAERYVDVKTVGEITASVRYREHEETGITEILDEVELPYTDGAEGFGMFDQAGELLTWWPAIAAPGSELVLAPGWGFRASFTNADLKTQTAAATAGG